MDTLTHALSGALAARVACVGGKRERRSRMLAGLSAAAFPDIDYALFWVAPLDFLNWHRGPTHSLLLLPVWALVLSGLFSWLTGRRRSWRGFYGVCALGLAVHIGGDVITVYGTKLLWPAWDKPFGLGIVFDVDPCIALIVAGGFTGLLLLRSRVAVAVTGLALVFYLALQTALYWRAVGVGEAFLEERGVEGRVYVLPQPFAPVLWKLVVSNRDRYFVAYLNHFRGEMNPASDDAGLLQRLWAAYRPVADLGWTEYRRFGVADEALAREVWRQDRFGAFRRFAELPALYRIDRNGGEVCVWFTDLRHNLPVLPPSFRYGMCRAGPVEKWNLYRLRYFRENRRQRLR